MSNREKIAWRSRTKTNEKEYYKVISDRYASNNFHRVAQLDLSKNDGSSNQLTDPTKSSSLVDNGSKRIDNLKQSDGSNPLSRSQEESGENRASSNSGKQLLKVHTSLMFSMLFVMLVPAFMT